MSEVIWPKKKKKTLWKMIADSFDSFPAEEMASLAPDTKLQGVQTQASLPLFLQCFLFAWPVHLQVETLSSTKTLCKPASLIWSSARLQNINRMIKKTLERRGNRMRQETAWDGRLCVQTFLLKYPLMVKCCIDVLFIFPLNARTIKTVKIKKGFMVL